MRFIDFPNTLIPSKEESGYHSCPDLNNLIDTVFYGDPHALRDVIEDLRRKGYFHKRVVMGQGNYEQLTDKAMKYFTDTKKSINT